MFHASGSCSFVLQCHDSYKHSHMISYTETSSNVVKDCFSQLNDPLKYLFEEFIERGTFSDALKTARVAPLLKVEILVISVTIDRHNSVPPCLSKFLERIMYNYLYKYLTTEKFLYSKQYGFQTGLSIERAIVKLVGQVYKSFEKDHYTLGVFIDWLKAFDTVDHTILISKFMVSRTLTLPGSLAT